MNRSFDRYLINGQKPDYRLKLEVAPEIRTIEQGEIIRKSQRAIGIKPGGQVSGLLFPAGMEKIGDSLYVLNLAVDGRYWKQFAQTVISQWAGQVKVHNIVRIPIPPFPK